VPALAQSTLMNRVLKGDEFSVANLLVPFGVSAALTAAALWWVARQLREAAVR
jgi:sodium transport system permease protein